MKIITSCPPAVLTVDWNVTMTSHTWTNICENLSAVIQYNTNNILQYNIARLAPINPEWIRFEDNNKLL